MTDIYADGCLKLCVEINQNRIGEKNIGKLSAAERRLVASRIAECTIFANKYAVRTDVVSGDVPPEDISIADLAMGVESGESKNIEITEEVLKETLSTGLFTSKGANRMGWAHQTYAEYLASFYIQQGRLSFKQLKRLIVHPSDSSEHIVPQLADK